MSTDLINDQAQKISTVVAPSFKLDPLTLIAMIMAIIQALQSLFASCKKNPTPALSPTPEQSATDFVNEHFDGTAYDPLFLMQATASTRRAARRQGQKLSHRESQHLAIVTLDQARTEDPTLIAQIMAEGS